MSHSYLGSSDFNSASSAVQSWYNEISDYLSQFGSEPPMSTFSKYGLFTQLIWKNSKLLGVGCASRGNSKYVVANYEPSGNVIGQFRMNVPAPIYNAGAL